MTGNIASLLRPRATLDEIVRPSFGTATDQAMIDRDQAYTPLPWRFDGA